MSLWLIVLDIALEYRKGLDNKGVIPSVLSLTVIIREYFLANGQ